MYPYRRRYVSVENGLGVLEGVHRVVRWSTDNSCPYYLFKTFLLFYVFTFIGFFVFLSFSFASSRGVKNVTVWLCH